MSHLSKLLNISEILVQFMKNVLKAMNVTISSYCIVQCRPRSDPRECGVYVESKQNYLNVPRFPDGLVVGTQCRPRSDCLWRSSLIRVYTVCHSICTFWTHYGIVQPPWPNFRVITANVSDVQNVRISDDPENPKKFEHQLLKNITKFLIPKN